MFKKNVYVLNKKYCRFLFLFTNVSEVLFKAFTMTTKKKIKKRKFFKLFSQRWVVDFGLLGKN